MATPGCELGGPGGEFAIAGFAAPALWCCWLSTYSERMSDQPYLGTVVTFL